MMKSLWRGETSPRRDIAALPWRTVFISAAVAVNAASAYCLELEGYKGWKFGTPAEQVRRSGLNCGRPSDDQLCTGGTDTLFGRKSDVSVWIRADEGVTKIDVSVTGMSPTELIRSFTESLGEPKKYIHPNLYGQRIEAHYWLSKTDTAVVVKRNLDAPEAQRVMGMTIQLSTASYLNAAETAKMLQEVRTYAPKPRDF